MIVVADTSPINYLILIEQINLLDHLYGRVLIPTAVYVELRSDRAPSAVHDWISYPPPWLEVHPVEFVEEPSNFDLDRGEIEAIRLAEALGAEQIILDDLRGRHEATRRGLAVIGTLGVLRQAARLGLVDIHGAVLRLQNTTFKISPHIIGDLLSEFQ